MVVVHIPVPAAQRVGEISLHYLRVEYNYIVHFSHSIIACMHCKHISNENSEKKRCDIEYSRKGVAISLITFPVDNHEKQCGVDKL